MKINLGQVWVRKVDAELVLIVGISPSTKVVQYHIGGGFDYIDRMFIGTEEDWNFWHKYVGELGITGTKCDCPLCKGVNYDR